jgi:hypothetical protein
MNKAAGRLMRGRSRRWRTGSGGTNDRNPHSPSWASQAESETSVLRPGRPTDPPFSRLHGGQAKWPTIARMLSPAGGAKHRSGRVHGFPERTPATAPCAFGGTNALLHRSSPLNGALIARRAA